MPQPPLPEDRGEQATRVVGELDTATGEVIEKRKAIGIQSDRLLVLEFGSLAAWGEPDVKRFEAKFAAHIVDERRVAGESDKFKLVVQFESAEGLALFRAQAERYGGIEESSEVLTETQRNTLFDRLLHTRALGPNDRVGPRLALEWWPVTATFGMDIELWHPGTSELVREVMRTLRELCALHDGRVADDLRTSSIIVCRVIGTRALGEALLNADLVARVDLPPRLPEEHAHFFEPLDAPPLPGPPTDAVGVCVVDSGVLSSHPMLAGWVLASEDFGSGEDTPADLHGHGTQVAGLVVHADFASGLTAGAWRPLVPIYSAKVLRKNGDRAEFPDDKSHIAMVERAIKHFAGVHGCRVFNLSLGNQYGVYAGERQFAWAAVIDQLVRDLDIVVVVSAGNVSLDSIPIPDRGATRESFQGAVRDGMLDRDEQRICDPATAALAITVGAIARMGELPLPPAGRDPLASLVGSPAGAPAAFSRVGPGYQGARKPSIKPDFVACGGNVRVEGRDNNVRWRHDPVLSELTTTVGDRLLTRQWGTSFAAPQVAQAAALALGNLRGVLGEEPSANLVRALLGATSIEPPCGSAWLRDPDAHEEADKLRLAGHGIIQSDRLLRSREHDLVMVADDEVGLDDWHVYRLPIPGAFLRAAGRRGITVALAFDPPTRVSRRAYLARTMDLEILKQRSLGDIEKAWSDGMKEGQPPLEKNKWCIGARPTSTVGERSTLQVRRVTWKGAPKLKVDANGVALLHVLVQCHKRFATDADDQPQSYGLAVRLWTEDPNARLRELVKANLNLRVTARQRVVRRR